MCLFLMNKFHAGLSFQHITVAEEVIIFSQLLIVTQWLMFYPNHRHFVCKVLLGYCSKDNRQVYFNGIKA